MTKLDEGFVFTRDIASSLSLWLEKRTEKQIFILQDSNVEKFCHPHIADVVEKFGIIPYVIPAGETHKNLNTAQAIWAFLLEHRADRKSSLFINLGGGVVTDLGAFAASLYKRGIAYINVPTTVLGMIDAAIGGKNGVNFKGFKNQIGMFGEPEKIFIYPDFLKSLSRRELLNGAAEMFKHALLSGEESWDKLRLELSRIDESKNTFSEKLLKDNIALKMRFVKADPLDTGLRAALNLGHTFGHAFEAAYAAEGIELKHGEAVAAGIICETFIAHKLIGMPLRTLLKITQELSVYFPVLSDIKKYSYALWEAMHFDKKNINGMIQCVLMEDWALPHKQIPIENELIKDALNFYSQL